jgi:hypothetical protein
MTGEPDDVDAMVESAVPSRHRWLAGLLVAEAARVLRPGGRLVLAHTDHDTLVFASDDLELTRRLVHAYCDTQQPWMDAVDGTIGRHLAEVAGRSGLVVEDVQATVVLSRRFVPGELGWGYAHNIVGALRAPGGRSRPRWTAGWTGCAGGTSGARSCSA